MPGAPAYSTGQELINADDVDAVLVCSWGPTHEEYVLASIAAGKPVFCEKPLATTQEACRRIIDAEVAFGRRLVQVGYMRRYDRGLPGAQGGGGQRRHRRTADDALHPPQPQRARALHQGHGDHRHRGARHRHGALDVRRGDRRRHGAQAAQEQNGGELEDPLLLLFEMASGALIDVETSVNIRYGYDIRGEVVGEDGTAALGDSSPVTVRKNNSVLRPGAGGLAGAVHRRLRRRVPGMDRRRPGRRRPTDPARGTATPPPWCPMPPSRPAPGTGPPSTWREARAVRVDRPTVREGSDRWGGVTHGPSPSPVPDADQPSSDPSSTPTEE